MIVNREKTQMTRETMRDALTSGHLQTFGFDASSERIACSLAMLCEEHANGSAVWNWNLGNIDAGSDWTGDTFALTADEVIRGNRIAVTKQLRAYTDGHGGGCGFWCFLAAHERFAKVLLAFDLGDPHSAAHALKVGGWYTGSEDSYSHAMMSIYREVYRS